MSTLSEDISSSEYITPYNPTLIPKEIQITKRLWDEVYALLRDAPNKCLTQHEFVVAYSKRFKKSFGGKELLQKCRVQKVAELICAFPFIEPTKIDDTLKFTMRSSDTAQPLSSYRDKLHRVEVAKKESKKTDSDQESPLVEEDDDDDDFYLFPSGSQYDDTRSVYSSSSSLFKVPPQPQEMLPRWASIPHHFRQKIYRLLEANFVNGVEMKQFRDAYTKVYSSSLSSKRDCKLADDEFFYCLQDIIELDIKTGGKLWIRPRSQQEILDLHAERPAEIFSLPSVFKHKCPKVIKKVLHQFVDPARDGMVQIDLSVSNFHDRRMTNAQESRSCINEHISLPSNDSKVVSSIGALPLSINQPTAPLDVRLMKSLENSLQNSFDKSHDVQSTRINENALKKQLSSNQESNSATHEISFGPLNVGTSIRAQLPSSFSATSNLPLPSKLTQNEWTFVNNNVTKEVRPRFLPNPSRTSSNCLVIGGLPDISATMQIKDEWIVDGETPGPVVDPSFDQHTSDNSFRMAKKIRQILKPVRSRWIDPNECFSLYKNYFGGSVLSLNNSIDRCITDFLIRFPHLFAFDDKFQLKARPDVLPGSLPLSLDPVVFGVDGFEHDEIFTGPFAYMQLIPDELVEILVVTVKDDGQFIVQLRKMEAEFTDLEYDMGQFYRNPFYNEAFVIDSSHLKVDLPVAACINDSWRRAKILRVHENGMLHITLVDIGTDGNISLRNVRFLHSNFVEERIPPCAIRTYLDRVDNIYNFQDYQKMVTSLTNTAHVIKMNVISRKPTIVPTVKIWIDTGESKPFELGQWLIENGYTSCSETTADLVSLSIKDETIVANDSHTKLESKSYLNNLDKDTSPHLNVTPPTLANQFSSESEQSTPDNLRSFAIQSASFALSRKNSESKFEFMNISSENVVEAPSTSSSSAVVSSPPRRFKCNNQAIQEIVDSLEAKLDNPSVSQEEKQAISAQIQALIIC